MSEPGKNALILMYHRVADVDSDPFSLCVAPHHFSEHLEVLRKCARPVPLTKLAAEIRNGGIPPRSVVLTLDDGYADNLESAKPALERYGVGQWRLGVVLLVLAVVSRQVRRRQQPVAAGAGLELPGFVAWRGRAALV